jgi:hypothetical protein
MYIHSALEEEHIRCNVYLFYSFLFLSISETIQDLSTLHILTTCQVFYFNEFYDVCKQMRFQSYLQR